MAREKLYSWTDTSDYGFQFAIHSMPKTGQTLLKVLSPELSVKDAGIQENLKLLGFKEATSGIWYAIKWTNPETNRIGNRIQEFHKEAMAVFPSLKMVLRSIEQIKGEGLNYVRRDQFIAHAMASIAQNPSLETKEIEPEEDVQQDAVTELAKENVSPSTPELTDTTQEHDNEVEPGEAKLEESRAEIDSLMSKAKVANPSFDYAQNLMTSVTRPFPGEKYHDEQIAAIHLYIITKEDKNFIDVKRDFINFPDRRPYLIEFEPELYSTIALEAKGDMVMPLFSSDHKLMTDIKDFIGNMDWQGSSPINSKEILLLSEKYNVTTGDTNRPFKLEFEHFKPKDGSDDIISFKSLTTYKFDGKDHKESTKFEFNLRGQPFFTGDDLLAYRGITEWLSDNHEEYSIHSNPKQTLTELLHAKDEHTETPQTVKENLVLSQQSNLIGVNRHGMMVYEDDLGRKIELKDGSLMRMSEDASNENFNPSDFLKTRVGTEHYDDDLRGIAEAIVRFSSERPLTKTDIIDYIHHSHEKMSREAIEESSVFRQVFEKIELVILTGMRESKLPPDELYPRMIELLGNQANSVARTSTSTSLQQYSTPLPLSIVVNELLNAHSFTGGTILEPTIGNGSLVSLLNSEEDRNGDSIEVVGYDLDRARIIHSTALLSNMVTPPLLMAGSFLDQEIPKNSFDRVVLNPPFGKADKHTFDDGLVTQRLDYQIAAQALNTLKDDGIGVLITGGDGFLTNDEGKIKGGSRFFYNWLADNFAGVNVVELSGSLYKKMGASFPIRLAVVAGRGKSEPIPDVIPVISSHEELWIWQESTKKEMAKVNRNIRQVTNQNSEALEVKEKPDNFLQEPKFDSKDNGDYFVGHNPEGICVYADKNEVRYILDGGKKISESVSIIPTPGGMVASPPSMTERLRELDEGISSNFLTTEEIEDHQLGNNLVSPIVINSPELTTEKVEPIVNESEPTAIPTATTMARKKAEEEVIEQQVHEIEEQNAEMFPYAQDDLFGEQEEPLDPLEPSEEIEPSKKGDRLTQAKVKEVDPNVIIERSTLEVIEVNESQARYTPMSNTAESEFLVPINMASGINQAQAKFMEEFGEADDFVANKLNYKVEDIGNYFSAEQIDSIAFAIASAIKDKGFIVGDMTGVGKGRIMAAMIKYSLIEHGRAIFITEKPELFQDIYRDLKGIGMKDSELSFTMTNSKGGNIKDPETDKLLHSYNKSKDKRLLDKGEWDKGEILLTTYSQINRQGSKSKKTRDILNLMERYQTGLTLDESHNASGTGSNTNINVKAMAELSAFVTFSSATSNKSHKTMALYSSCFPKDVVNLATLEQTLETGGAPLMEAVTTALAQDQSLLTRQHNLSNLTFGELENHKSKERNIHVTNGVAKVSILLGKFSGELKTIAEVESKDIKKKARDLSDAGNEDVNASLAGVTSMAFGSRLYNISRSVALLNNLELIVDEAEKAIKNGQKPVIALESTMGSLLNEFIDANATMGPNGKVVDRTPTLGDIFHSILERMQTVTVKTGWGKSEQVPMVDLIVEQHRKSTTNISPDAWEALEKQIRADFKLRVDEMHAQIDDDIPVINANPIDYIKAELEKRGISSMELSGRNTELVQNLDGTFDVLDRDSKKGRNQSVHDFNSGKIDVAIITKAGMTGISLHSSVEFKDQRQRLLIVAQAPSDPNTYMQMNGRINRKGQVNLPEILIVNDLMPSSFRLIAMLNQKLMNQSASTQANRESKYKTTSTPDLLNVVGDEVVFNYLKENPEIVNDLISLGVKLEMEGEAYGVDIARKVTGYVCCFPYDKQVEIYNDLSNRFLVEVDLLEKQGVSPFSQQVADFKAKEISAELFDGAEKPTYNSVFELPVYLKEIEYQREVKALSSKDVNLLLEEGQHKLSQSSLTNHQPDLVNISKLLEERKDDLLLRSLGMAYSTVGEALNSDEVNKTQSLNQRIDFLIKATQVLKPGAIISYKNYEADTTNSAVVTGVTLDSSALHLPSSYTVKFVSPGNSQQSWSLSFLESDPDFELNNITTIEERPSIISDFDLIEAGFVTQKRVILDGNPLKCAEIASQKGQGKTVFLTMDNGSRKLVTLMPVLTRKDELSFGTTAISDPEIVTKFLFDDAINPAHFIANTVKDDNNVTVSLGSNRNGEIKLKVPGTKKHGAYIFENPKILKLVDDGEFFGTRSKMTAMVPKENLKELVSALMDSGVVFKTEQPKARDWLLNEQAEKLKKVQQKLDKVEPESKTGITYH